MIIEMRTYKTKPGRREDDQVVAPVRPRVAPCALVKHRVEAVSLEQVRRVRGIRERAIFLADAEPEQLQSLLQARVVEHRLMLSLPAFPIGRRRSHTPLSPLTIGVRPRATPWTPAAVACGPSSRKTTRLSGNTSGDTTAGTGGACPGPMGATAGAARRRCLCLHVPGLESDRCDECRCQQRGSSSQRCTTAQHECSSRFVPSRLPLQRRRLVHLDLRQER
jgi:hypothetical protein